MARKKDLSFDYFEPFDCPPRSKDVIEIAKKYDVTLHPEGGLFQGGVLMDTTQTPGFVISLAGSQTGKSRVHLIEAIIMMIGRIPFSLQFEKGVDTGIPRLMDDESIARFGIQPDGTCGNIVGAGIYPKEKIPDRDSGAEIWISSYKEVKEKMWKKRLEMMIPDDMLENKKGRMGWSQTYQTFTFKSGLKIRLNTYEQEYKKTEGEWAHMIILDEEPPVRDYFISATEHCTYLRLCYTPINGLGWSHADCYKPIVEGKNQNSHIYTCTQFDSPFQSRQRIDAKFSSYKPHEIKSRVFGQYSEIEGTPYFSFEITSRYLKRYAPRHTLNRILPPSIPERAADALNMNMRIEQAYEQADDVWEIYEPLDKSATYWMSVDTAEGSENPADGQNYSCAYIRRIPREDEKEPMMVAALMSRLRTMDFAWLCLYGACYFNNCLIAPETGVSATGAVFVTTLNGYPFFYKHVNTNDKTHRLQEKIGFDSKEGTRKYAFELIDQWLNNHPENSKIYHYRLLKEIASCIVGKNGKPDHSRKRDTKRLTPEDTTDCLMAFGISEYVYAVAPQQIRNNRRDVAAQEIQIAPGTLFPNILGFGRGVRETRPVLGSRIGLDRRFGYRQPVKRLY